jgi:6,7-dimethyl-8-ribityllumazine synthase
MSSKDKNLSNYQKSAIGDCSNLSIGIIVSEWNTEITNALEKSCYNTLIEHGVRNENIFTERVPGSFELPLGAKFLDSQHKLDAIICLGCVIKGETTHNEYINQSVSTALMQLSLLRNKPYIFGVLTPNNMEQALERAGGAHGNKGVEAAVTALQMCMLSKKVYKKDTGIGFNK